VSCRATYISISMFHAMLYLRSVPIHSPYSVPTPTSV
jgi:hypothetical protein